MKLKKLTKKQEEVITKQAKLLETLRKKHRKEEAEIEKTYKDAVSNMFATKYLPLRTKVKHIPLRNRKTNCLITFDTTYLVVGYSFSSLNRSTKHPVPHKSRIRIHLKQMDKLGRPNGFEEKMRISVFEKNYTIVK